MRIVVTDLVGHPGETRRLVRDLARVDLGEESWGPAEGALAGRMHLDVQLDSVVEGVLVRGDVVFPHELACARCLEPVVDELEVDVAELFRPQGHEDAEAGYEIIDAAIDLEPLLRDTVLMALPVRVLCRDDCAGLCVTCGANLNEQDCGHRRTEPVDPRWAKLAEIELPSHN